MVRALLLFLAIVTTPWFFAYGAEVEYVGEESDAVEYDMLPLRYADMDTYDQIAMEPYKAKYDSMPLGEKARIYGRQFEFMRDRKPNFPPEVWGEVDRYEEAQQATSAYDTKKFLYKPPTAKKRRIRKKVEQVEVAQPLQAEPNPLQELSGPWEQMPAPEPDPEPPAEEGDEYEEEEPDDRYTGGGALMENLRQGWNAIDVVRGRRQ